ncbi:cephalosporin-C deacetylase-like acetyl esterase [Streptomyces sp. 3330]|uniref:alpha/beta hydrolase n=1 Tax=Streptomyces sp. 3330 TaxID=2817755 RepID=UPI00285E3B7F|nr:alpha/beta hydrolase [Streptomyces sp. 3330]MDR6976448.1 cephalosporin-C deacetylase-like acetyl esterase [Streptomyces sp. 3330]
MRSLHFTADTSSDGVRERDFTIGEVTGVLRSPAPAPASTPASASASAPESSSTVTGPASGPERAPLVLLGHGGGGHRKAPAVTGRARLLVTGCGFHVATIDAPGHGDRPRSAHDEREIAALRRAMAQGEPVGPLVVRYNAHLAERAVPEWRATLDALQELPEIGAGGPVGYFGLHLGTAIGVPLTAVEPRIRAAVFGLFWPDTLAEAARRVTVPVEFALQWDDEHIPREAGLALFDAFASAEKTLHANAGAHAGLPRFEADSAARFLARHLGRSATAPV